MKLIALFLSIAVAGCVSIAKQAEAPEDKIKSCIQATHDMVDLYGDLCAESSSGYEDMNGSDAHFEGVKCASETIRWCLED